MEDNVVDHVYYIVNENKLSIVTDYTHYEFMLFVFTKANKSIDENIFPDILESIYKDVVYLGEL